MSSEILAQGLPAVIAGLKLTLLISILAFLLGEIVALPIGLARASNNYLLRAPASAYTFIFRGSPLLVQLFVVYYGLGQLEVIRDSFLWIVIRSPINCAIVAIGLNSAAYVAVVIAGAVRQLPTGQIEACHTLGLSRFATLVHIILPQAYRSSLPWIGNQSILDLKASSLASAVTVLEMTGAARDFVAQTYAPFEVFAAASVLYLVFGMIFGQIFQYIERFVAVPGSTARRGSR